MARAIRPSLYDILQAIEGIESALAGKSFDEFCHDWVLRHAVQRGIEIISQACRRIPDELRKNHPEIPWRNILGIGNVLRHEYESVSDEIIWNAVQSHLPPLKEAIKAIERTLPSDG